MDTIFEIYDLTDEVPSASARTAVDEHLRVRGGGLDDDEAEVEQRSLPGHAFRATSKQQPQPQQPPDVSHVDYLNAIG